MKNETLENYFRNVWKPNTSKYTYSGWDVCNKIPKNHKILDVGCGYNEFKNIFNENLIGIDPYNSNADIEVSIEDFHTDEMFDSIICFGSINFGDENTIMKQINKVTSLCKSGGTIYWRQNPGKKDHANIECQQIDFFEWSFEKNIEYSKLFGYNILILALDENRIYSEWQKI